MSRRRRITSKGRELIKKRSYYNRYTLRSCRPKFSKKGTRRNTYCLLRRSKSRKRRSKSKKRRSKSKKRRSKRDGMDDEDSDEDSKIDWTKEIEDLRKYYMEDYVPTFRIISNADIGSKKTPKTPKTSNKTNSKKLTDIRRSRKRRSRSKRDGMDKPIISWRSLPKTRRGIPLPQGFEEYKIDWTGYVTKTRSRSYEEIKRRQAAYAKWKKEQEKLS